MSVPPVLPPDRAGELNRLVAMAYQARKQGHHEACGRLSEQALAIDRRRPEPWLLLCASLAALGSADTEKAMADALAALGPDSPVAPMLEADRARALANHARWTEATDMARRAAARPALSPGVHNTLGSTFAAIGLYDEALHHARIAADALPDAPMAVYNLATVLRYLGRLEEAEALYERVIALDPNESLAYASLAGLRKWTPERNHVDQLRAAIARTPEGGEALPRLHYALFSELDGMKQTEAAWAELERGAALARRLFPFVEQDRIARTQALIDAFPAESFARPEAHAPSGPRPIFVLGLPRSGTTLTERILAAHSQVRAMGETTGFTLALKEVVGPKGPQAIDNAAILRAGKADWAQVARFYHEHTRYQAGDAAIVTDKLPHNYEFAGPIALAFPEGGIVHVQRNPMDSLFGTLKLLFGEGGYHWSYSFEDLAANYRQYRRLMDHWRTVLGPRFVEITLEDLIDNQDREIRRLVAACGLGFEEACLRPDLAEGGVATASATQVRSPINRNGVGAWRRYERQLEPLRALLEADGFVDAQGEPVWENTRL